MSEGEILTWIRIALEVWGIYPFVVAGLLILAAVRLFRMIFGGRD